MNIKFDEDLLFTTIEVEREAWMAFKSVVTKFLGNNKDPDYVTIIANILKKFKVLGCLLSLKIHFFNSHLEFIPENLGTVSEEQGERFHQDIKEMERRYQGQCNVKMICDYCWTLNIAKFRKAHIRGRAIYANPPAKKDSTRPLNKIYL
jgi:hypothetical protein